MMWQRAIPYFQDRYRLVLVDLRGHGKSSCPASGYHMDDMAGDVVGLLNQLQLDRAHIIGSSMGAEVGLSLAAHFPELVRSLVCDGALSSESGPYSTREGTQAEYQAHVAQQLQKMHAAPEKVYPSVDDLVAQSRQGLEGIGWWNQDVEAMERYGAHKLEDGGYVRAFRKFAREDYFRHYFSYQLEDYYRRVECPLLMVAGDDAFEDEAERRAMQGLCGLAARGRITKLDGWQHPYGWMLDPATACKTIMAFLGEVDHDLQLDENKKHLDK